MSPRWTRAAQWKRTLDRLACSPYTLPQLAPTTLFVIVTTTIAAFQLFTPVYMMTKGGPRRTTDVVLYHIFNEAWQKFEVGMASAESYVLFALILLATACQLWIMRRSLRAEALQ